MADPDKPRRLFWHSWFWLVLGLGVALIIVIASVVLRAELMEPGLQYLWSEGEALDPRLINVIALGPALMGLAVPQSLVLAALCRWPRPRVSAHRKAEALVLIGLAVLLFSLWIPAFPALIFLAALLIAGGFIWAWWHFARRAWQRPSWNWLDWVAMMQAVIGPMAALPMGAVLWVAAQPDRQFGQRFFDPDTATGGLDFLNDPMLFQHILWFLGHPEIGVFYPSFLLFSAGLALILSLLGRTYRWSRS